MQELIIFHFFPHEMKHGGCWSFNKTKQIAVGNQVFFLFIKKKSSCSSFSSYYSETKMIVLFKHP